MKLIFRNFNTALVVAVLVLTNFLLTANTASAIRIDPENPPLSLETCQVTNGQTYNVPVGQSINITIYGLATWSDNDAGGAGHLDASSVNTSVFTSSPPTITQPDSSGQMSMAVTITGVALGTAQLHTVFNAHYSSGNTYQCNRNGFSTVNVTQSASTPDFALDCANVTPSMNQTKNVDDTASWTVPYTTSNSLPGAITFSISGAPPASTVTGSSTSTPPPASGSQAVSLDTSSSTPAGNYNVVITATSGSTTKTCQSVLILQAQSGFLLNADYINPPDNRGILKGSTAVYAISATCFSSYAGPINSLTATSGFSNVSYLFTASSNLADVAPISSMNCGATVYLKVISTASTSPLSSPGPTSPTIQSQTVTVSGTGQ